MFSKFFLVTALFAVSASAMSPTIPAKSSFPNDWVVGAPVPDHHARTFTIALRHDASKLARFTSLVSQITDPSSPLFRHFLTTSEIREMTSSSPMTSSSVVAWLESHGAESVVLRGDYVKVTASGRAVRSLLGGKASLREFRHVPSGSRAVRAHGEVVIPGEIAREIAFFTGLFEMPFVRADGVKVERPRADTLSTFVMPKSLNKLYGIPSNSSKLAANSIGVIEFGPSPGFKKDDWSKFITGVAGRDSVPGYPTIVGPFTAAGDPNLDGECTLDIEYVSGLTDADSYFISISDGWIYDMASTLADSDNAPTTVSVSYGLLERMTCEIVSCSPDPNDPSEYIGRTEVELQKLAAKGMTVLVSSGDTGANGGRSPQDQNCQDSEHPIGASYPASSAWVTAVGATMFSNDSPAPQGWSDYCDDGSSQFTPCSGGTGTEVTCSYPDSRITTGGGFSTVVPMPQYQRNAVQQYLQNPSNQPPARLFNSSMRGFPDIAAMGARILVRDTNLGQPGVPAVIPVAGTSASAPIAAALLAHANAYAIQNLGGPLGFLNPMLYAAFSAQAGVFNDVTVGNNKATEQATCQYGYYAAPGWDATTGLGSIQYNPFMVYLNSQIRR